MKRTMKLITSLCLSVLLILSTLGISAFAATPKPHKNLKYRQYCYLGDSIPFGYGLVSQAESSDPFSVGVRVQNSYPDLVGDVLEASAKTKIQPAASSGSRLCDYRILLERGLGVKDPYNVKDDWYGMRKPERTVRLRAMGPTICDWISNSDLITMQVGINDITGLLINSAYATGLIDIDKIKGLSGVNDIIDYLGMVIGNLSKDSDILGNFIRTFQKELSGIVINAQVVVKDVQMIAPKDADFLIVGYHMAAQGLRIIPGTPRSLVFDIVDSALEALNTCFKVEAQKYDNVYYVAAPDAEVFYPKGTTAFECLQDTSYILMGVHPNAKGHKYIAKQVINKLDEINS